MRTKIFTNIISSCIILTILISYGCGNKKKTESEVPQLKVLELNAVKSPVFLEMVGIAEGIPTIQLNARVEGFLESFNFIEGTLVQKGQLLFTIEQDNYINNVNNSKALLDHNQAAWEQSVLVVNRLTPLLPTAAISQNDFDVAVSNEKQSKASVESAQAQLDQAKLNLSYTKVYSPITGIIGKTMVRPGNLVGPSINPLLATVSAVDPIYFNFQMNESDYLMIVKYLINTNEREQEDLKKNIKVHLFLADGFSYPIDGTMDFMDRSINTETGTIAVRALFPNKNYLIKPGSYGTIRLILKEVDNAIFIPQGALNQIQDKFFAYKLNNINNTVNRVSIKVGRRIDNRIMVISGLNPGDKILLEGFQKFEEGMKINPQVIKDTLTKIKIDE